MINEGLMSSKTELWETPKDFFEQVNKEFNFTLDACAMPFNAKLENYFSPEQNSLEQKWTGVVWMNPPYGRTISTWMAKAVQEWRGGATIVCLVPARTDTAWWHDYAMLGEIRFLRGRLKFIDEFGESKNSAPFPSALVIFRDQVS